MKIQFKTIDRRWTAMQRSIKLLLMPFPVVAALAAGSQIASQFINADQTKKNNAAERDWNERMYTRQRADALYDLKQQNEYNSPSAQMQRLRDAKLNPNLVYGNGATTTSGVTRGTDVKGWNPTAPSYDLASPVQSGLSAYYDIQLKEAQTDNLKTANTVATQDALLKAAQTAATLQNTKGAEFKLFSDQSLFDTVVEAAQANLRKLQVDTDYQLQQGEINVMDAAIRKRGADMGIITAAEAILKSRSDRATSESQRQHINAQIKNLQYDAELKKLDIQLKRLGIQPGDPMYMRALGRILGDPSKMSDLKGTFKSLAPKPIDSTKPIAPRTFGGLQEGRWGRRSK